MKMHPNTEGVKETLDFKVKIERNWFANVKVEMNGIDSVITLLVPSH